MSPQGRTVPEILAEIGGRQHGVVSRTGLLNAGLTPGEIRSRVRSGELLREYPGVYRVGHRAPSREARYLAAVRACGEGAALSGMAAAHLHMLIVGAEPVPEVTAQTQRRVPGVITHRSRRLDGRETTVCLGIPVTSVARTLVDL